MGRASEMIGQYFSRQEFEQSETGARLGISNRMGDVELYNAKLLCEKTLDPIRIALDMPVVLNSGYRCKELNRSIPNSSNTSQHMVGQAADIFVPRMSISTLFGFIIKSGIPFDQLIEEGTWVHVSYKVRPRGQVLRARFSSSGVVYTQLDVVPTFKQR